MSEQQPVFNIQRVYLKDMSLEIPHAPQIFLEQGTPSVDIEVGVGTEQLAEGTYETNITLTLTTRVTDKVAFLAEAKQAGIFQIMGVPAEDLEPIQHIVCANIVYPYLRSNIADMVQRAGFPPIHLQEINFEVLYQQRIQHALQNKEAASPGIVGADGQSLTH